MSFVQLLYINI